MKIISLKTAFCTVFVFLSIAWIVVLNYLPLDEKMACFLIDKREGGMVVNYFAVQNAMWMFFFVGLALILYRLFMCKCVRRDMFYFEQNLRMYNDTLFYREFGMHLQNIRAFTYVVNILQLMVKALQRKLPTEKVSLLIDKEWEIVRDEIDVEYNMIRYVAWCLPTLGFLGTVLGVLNALDRASAIAPTSSYFLPMVIGRLSTAFWTTLLGLILTSILLWLMNLIYNAEERLLIKNKRYFNRLLNEEQE